MEKLHKPPILDAELGAKRLALANAQSDVNLNNADDVQACINQNVALTRARNSENVFEFVGRKTVELLVQVKHKAA